MAHIHAEKMMRYAQDALESETPWDRWEFKYKNEDCWFNCQFGPRWVEGHEYRRKPKTININGFEVPEPLYKKPIENIEVYCPISPLASTVNIESDFLPDNVFSDGIVFKTKEDCQKYIDAVLSFTKKDEKEA